MFDELDSYLGVITTPENQRLLITTCELLAQAGIISHESDIETILRTGDEHTTDDNLLDLFSLLTEYATNTIGKFGVVVDERMPLGILNKILEALMVIPDYGDPEMLLSILQSELSSVEKLCDVFSEVTSLSWGDFAPYVEDVQPAFLPRMEEVVEGNIPPEGASEDVELYRKRFSALRDYDPQSLSHTVIREGFRLKSPLSTLVGRFHDDLDEMASQPTVLADGVLSLLLISDTPDEQLLSMGEELLEDYAKDINVTTKAHGAFLKLLGEVKNA